jgi:ADP-heptose:LPS heptosyltransferase
LRTLLIRPGAIGDTIAGLPALEHLASAEGTVYSEVWVRSELVPLIRFADRVRPIAETGLDMVEIDPPPGTMRELASFRRIHSWYGANRDQFRAAVHRLPFEFHAALPSGGVHAADFFARQVGAPEPAIPRIRVEAEPHGALVVHPYSGSPKKNWPYERFVELSRRIPVEWAAGPGGVRFQDLGRLASWLAGARMYVGNDSGITHLAAAVGVPVVALFGPTDPAVWAPRGSRVRVLRAEVMEDLAVQDVLEAVSSLE